ncbi:hypothetical protein L0Y65_06740 [Candidatus Micrarchaeota archaeon]|nr:hypothetical protein [Candidatus Micrarchaeota archaeon]
MARLLDTYNKKNAGKGKGGGDAPKLPEPAVDMQTRTPGPQDGPAPRETPLQSKRDMDLLAAECSERKAFEAVKHVVLTDTAPRIQLGTIITREFLATAGLSPEPGELTGVSNIENLTPYVINFGRRPKQVKGHLSLVGSEGPSKSHEDKIQANFYSMVFEAQKLLKAFALPPDTGPFTDIDGVIKMYADHLFQGGVPADAPVALLDMIERVIDSRPVASSRLEAIEPRLFRGHSHVYNAGVETPDDPINASLILTSASRLVRDEVSNAVSLSIAHPWEPYLIGVAALRSRNVPAYLGQVLVPFTMGDEVPDYLERDSVLLEMGRQAALAAPIIAIIDPAAESALRIFRMSRLFPPIGAIDILSDIAAEGAAYAIRAEMRVKHLAFEMIRRAQEGEVPLNEAEYQLALTRIARCLFQSVKRWDGNPLVPRVLSGVESGVQEGAFSLSVALFGQHNTPEVTIAVAGAARELLKMDMPEMFAPQNAVQSEGRDIAVFAKTAGRNAASTMQAVLKAWLKKAEANKSE